MRLSFNYDAKITLSFILLRYHKFLCQKGDELGSAGGGKFSLFVMKTFIGNAPLKL